MFNDGPPDFEVVRAEIGACQPMVARIAGKYEDGWLIAAAPELLATLKRVVDLANCAMDYSGVDAEHTLKRAMERISKAKCVCETAIAKAEGVIT
jgi:hypothetical protein